MARRTRRRRKSISVAVSATLAASPLASAGVAAADGGPSVATTGSADSNSAAAQAASRIVLHYGSVGALVAAAQQRLNQVLPLTHLAVDGIFGPKTRAAVRDFQRRNGDRPTGAISAGLWAALFRAPVLVLGQETTSASASAASPHSEFISTSMSGRRTGRGVHAAAAHGAASDAQSGRSLARHRTGRTSATSNLGGPGHASGSTIAGSGGGSSAGTGGGGTAGGVTVVTPTNPTSGSSTYVLINGVALPLPRQYLVNGYVDQGVDYSAPGGTPEYAMGDGVIIGEGISGFGPNAPILKITSGPLKGLIVYYGHAGPDLVKVGQHVKAGQQISEVGYGIVGISTGPHLEIGFYPPGHMGAGSKMLALINKMLAEHRSGRVWGSHVTTRRTSTTRRTAARATATRTATTTTIHTTSTASDTGSSSGTTSGSASGGAAVSGTSSTASATPSSTTAAPAQSAPTSNSAPAPTAAAPAPTTTAAPAPTGTAAPAPTTAAPAPTTAAAPTSTAAPAPNTSATPAPTTTATPAPTTAAPAPATAAAPAPTTTAAPAPVTTPTQAATTAAPAPATTPTTPAPAPTTAAQAPAPTTTTTTTAAAPPTTTTGQATTTPTTATTATTAAATTATTAAAKGGQG
jgi:murein DD-endopeptidase MepM/ murein hydrolase activator NlpD